MSSDKAEKGIRLGLNVNTAVTIISAAAISWFVWSNGKQLEVIRLNQDKAILQVEAEVQDKYVTKAWFTSEHNTTQTAVSELTKTTERISDSLAQLRTDTAVIKNELQKQGK